MNLLNRSAVISIPEADERMKGYFSLSQPSSLIAEVLPENNTLSVPRCDLKGLEWLQLKSSSIQPSRGNAKTQSSTSECKECRKMKLTSVGFLWFSPLFFCFHLQEPLITKYFVEAFYQSKAESQRCWGPHTGPTPSPGSHKCHSGDLTVRHSFQRMLDCRSQRPPSDKLNWLTLNTMKHKQDKEAFLIRIILYTFLNPEPPPSQYSKRGNLSLEGYTVVWVKL